MPGPRALSTLVAFAVLTVAARPGLGQAPAAVAEERVDVDGDGVADVIRIENPPAVSVQLTGTRGPSSSQWKPFATSQGALVSGTITTGSGKRFGGRRVIVATAELVPGGRAPGQAMILSFTGTELTTLWEGQVGSQGHDGDYRVVVEATPQGIVRYQSRDDVRRCDGKPVHLFAEAWDFGQSRFRPVFNPVSMPADAPALVATRTPPRGSAPASGVVFRTQAASSQDGAAHAGELAPPRELDDGDSRTVWREGTGGDGRGELITLTAPIEAAIVGVRMVPGDASSQDLFVRGNRLARAGLLIDERAAFWIELPVDPAREGRAGEPYWVTLPEGVRGRCVTLIIDKVYAGRGASARGGDTALADLAVLTDLDMSEDGPDSALVAQALAGGSGGEAAARLLGARGPLATAAILSALRHSGRTDEERLRLRRVLARTGDPRAADQLVEALAAPELGSSDRRLFATALGRMGGEAIAPLGALLAAGDAEGRARREAARVLAGLADPRAQEALLGAAGAGDRELRLAVAVALGQRTSREMPALVAAMSRAEAAGDSAREADLVRALGLMARHAEPAEQGVAAEVLIARLGAASGYELLYRLLGAAAGLDHEALLDSLGAALARTASADTAEARALRRVTATGLARNRGGRARALLIALAADADPGVRAVAVDSLGQREDLDAATDQALIGRLGGDGWPRIRRAAASSLARRCGQVEPVATALGQAVDSDADVEVRRAALGALVECRAPGIAVRLVAVARDERAPLGLRERAVTLMPVLGDRELAGALVSLFASLRKRAWSDKDAIELAASVAVAMGRLGGAGVVEPLLAAAREGSFPEIQAAALTGLGELCVPAALPLFERLRSDSQRGVAIAARGAYNRCRGRSP